MKAEVNGWGVVLKTNGVPTILAYVWMDRNRRYFISTASFLQDGKGYSRIRWRQPDLPEETLAELTMRSIATRAYCVSA